ncbi:MAG: hypothetical protein ACKOFN_06450, partial [Vulcanococcus sp.]
GQVELVRGPRRGDGRWRPHCCWPGRPPWQWWAWCGGPRRWLLFNRQALPLLPQPTTEQAVGTAPSTEGATPGPIPPVPDLQQAALDNAIATVQQLYSDLSNGNGEAARQRIGAGAADQFDLAFFSQFQRVGVSDLREIGRSGALVSLEGVVTFVYPDGSSQSESRSFVVDTATQPPLITASGFNQVLKARQ